MRPLDKRLHRIEFRDHLNGFPFSITPMNDGLAALEGATPEEIAERSAGNLLPVPWVEAEDVAEAVLFLASDRARYVTGSEFVLDAGLLTR